MGVKWNPKGIITLIAQTIGVTIAAGSSNQDIVAAASTIGSGISAILGGISVSGKKSGPAEIYVQTFENVVRECMVCFETNGKDDEVIEALSKIECVNYQITEGCTGEISGLIRKVLYDNGVYTKNISDDIIDSFIHNISAKMIQKIKNNESLLAFITNACVEETNTIVKNTKTMVNEIDTGVRDNHELLIQIKSILDESACTSMLQNKENSIQKVNDISKVVSENKSYYINKWNERLFLHRDENDKHLTLANTFIYHDYNEINTSTGQVIDKNSYDKATLEEQLKDFIDNRDCGSVLVTGVPGMGKSSLVAYLANEYKDDSRVIILRFKDFNIYNTDDIRQLLKAIAVALDKRVEELGTYFREKVLILDGFDELRQSTNNQKWLSTVIDFLDAYGDTGLIITSRENYVDLNQNDIDRHYRISAFTEEKIKAYYKTITDKELPAHAKISSIEVLGVPVILYMALSLPTPIDVTGIIGEYELYDKIFALDGGIFDRFKLRGVKGYEQGGHPIKSQKKAFIELLSELAFYMFEHYERPVSKDVYLEIVGNIKDSNGSPMFGEDTRTIFDFPIKYLYEGTNNIEFVHGSIYEYFTAEYIYQTLMSGVNVQTEEEKKVFAGKLGKLLKKRVISLEIRDYLYYKIQTSKKKNSSKFLFDAFELMLNDGMTYYTSYYTEEFYKNVITCELNIFANILEIIHAWAYRDTISIHSKKQLEMYIRRSYSLNLNLKKFDLKRVNLSGADLKRVNLNRADLRGANLSNSNLSSANLSGAYLSKANLSGACLDEANLGFADLCGANLSFADLSFADLCGTDMRDADLRGADLRFADLGKTQLNIAVFDTKNIKDVEKKRILGVYDARVYIDDLDKIVSYEDYKYWLENGYLPQKKNSKTK